MRNLPEELGPWAAKIRDMVVEDINRKVSTHLACLNMAGRLYGFEIAEPHHQVDTSSLRESIKLGLDTRHDSDRHLAVKMMQHVLAIGRLHRQRDKVLDILG